MYRIGDVNFDLVRVKQDTKQPLYEQHETSIENSYSDMSLIVPKGIVVIDADDVEVANTLFKIYKDKTHWVKTTRGYHFYFKLGKSAYLTSRFQASKFSSNRYNLLGLHVDYKKNLPNLNDGKGHLEAVKVKANGVIRESGNDIISELPLELYPLDVPVENGVHDLFNIIDLSESRNTTFMTIIGKLLNYTKIYNYNVDMIEQTLNVMNDYIIADPLPNDEMNALIGRISHYAKVNDNVEEGVRSNTFTQNTKYQKDLNPSQSGEIAEMQVQSGVSINSTTKFIDAIVNYISKEYILVRYQEHLYIKDKDVNNVKFEDYSKPVEMGAFLEYLGIYILNKSFVNEVIFKCEIKAKPIYDEEMSVIFKNGYILDQETGDIIKYNNEFSNIIVDTEYHPPRKPGDVSDEEHEYRELVDNFMKFIADGGVNESFYIRDENNPNIHDNGETARHEVENVLDQILGHCLMTKKLPQYAYFFTGSSGANGKSTWFHIIKNLFGENNTSALSLDQLTEDYTLIHLTKSLVNIGDDINDSYIESSTQFKTIVTNEPITIREIRESPIQTKIFSTLLYNCNEMPRFKDVSGGIERRLKIIPMFKQVADKDKRNDLEEVLSHPYARQRLLERALNGFKKLRQNKGIIKFGRVIDMESEKYFQLIDAVRGFLFEELTKDVNLMRKNLDYKDKLRLVVDKWIDVDIDNIYSRFKDFCDADGRKYPIHKNKFKQRIANEFNLSVVYEHGTFKFKKEGDSKFIL